MACSFCCSYFHNIRGCQDPMIDLFYERIKVIYIDTMNQYPRDTEIRFKNIINRRFNLRELKAVCATHTNFPSSIRKSDIIEILYNHYSSRIYTLPREEQAQPWLEVRRLPTQPDPIPDFARDLEQSQTSEEDRENDISYYIDTIPTPISVLRFALLQQTPERIRIPYIYHHINHRDERRGIPLTNTLRRNNNIVINLNSEFDSVATIPEIKKYDIHPVLVSDENDEGVEECAICYESIKCIDLVKLNCSHKFCGSCIKGSLRAHNNIYCGPSCALCRTQMVSFSVKNPEIYNMVAEHCNL